MIDRAFNYLGQHIDNYDGSHLRPDMAAQETLIRAEQPSKNLTAVFGSWHASSRLLRTIADRITRRGSDALIFRLHPLVLNDDYKLVRQFIEHIANTSSESINRATTADGHDYSRTSLIGLSLGNVPMAISARKIHNFDDVTMVTPGSYLFQCVWQGARTQRLRRSLSDKALPYTIQKSWTNCAPSRHVAALKGHDIRVVLSRRDHTVPYIYGKDLVRAMQANGVEPKVDVNRRLGHMLTIASFVHHM